jgi:hypothetical protein
MRENRTSGLMSGMWKRSTAEMLGHSQTKGRATGNPNLSLHHRATSRLYHVFRVVTGTGSRLALSAPRQWVDRSEREVSGIMLEVATALGRVPHETEEGDVPAAARLRAAYLNVGRAARRRYAGLQPISPRDRGPCWRPHRRQDQGRLRFRRVGPRVRRLPWTSSARSMQPWKTRCWAASMASLPLRGMRCRRPVSVPSVRFRHPL